jgi:protein-L-isoaspartate O-methyltransferase
MHLRFSPVPVPVAAACLLAGWMCAAAAVAQQAEVVPYVPSPQGVVADMLKIADVGPDDFVIDLGSGDGRIVLTAAKVYGARGFGVEIKEDLVNRSNEAAQELGIADRVKFIAQDLFATDISQASVLTMYLLPETVNMLSTKLQKELKPGTRIISHDYSLAGWRYEKRVHMDLEDKVPISGVTTTYIYLYVVPAQVAGRWRAKLAPDLSRQPVSLEFKQQLQMISGAARVGGREVELEDAKLLGDRISFRLVISPDKPPLAFTGQVKGSVIEGTIESRGAKSPWIATLAAK